MFWPDLFFGLRLVFGIGSRRATAHEIVGAHCHKLLCLVNKIFSSNDRFPAFLSDGVEMVNFCYGSEAEI